jgi:uncharacterized protein (AIM24 family)
MAEFEILEHESQKLVRATLDNETLHGDPDAFYTVRGAVEFSRRRPKRYAGRGEVVLGPPWPGEYLVETLDHEAWVLAPGAYVCSEAGIEVRGRTVQGSGKVVLRAPGPVERIHLDGGRLTAAHPGCVVAWSPTVVRTSGGFEGPGVVLLAAIPNRLHRLQALLPPPDTTPRPVPLGYVVAAVLLALLLGLASLWAVLKATGTL